MKGNIAVEQLDDPSLASEAIEAEPTVPKQIAVRDFTFYSSSVSENASPFHRGADLFRSNSAEERRIEIGRDAAARLSAQAAKRLSKMGLPAVRVPRDSDMPLYDNTLLVTGRLNQVDEGNRFTRIAVGLGCRRVEADDRGPRVSRDAWRARRGACVYHSCRQRKDAGSLTLDGSRRARAGTNQIDHRN
jgi:hypothetical protein